jgi:hypothetical protein
LSEFGRTAVDDGSQITIVFAVAATTARAGASRAAILLTWINSA